MILLGKKYARTSNYNYIIIAIAFYAFIFGLRYGVGSDYFNYVNAYDELVRTGQVNEEWEIGFLGFMKLLAPFNSRFLFLGSAAFIQLFLVAQSLKEEKKLFPFLFFAFMFSCVWLGYSNLIRQIIAIGFWMLAVMYAVNEKYNLRKRIILYYVMVAAAFLFHKSSIILIPLFPLIAFKSDWFKSVKLELILLACALVLMRINIVQDVIANMDQALNLLGYSQYGRYEELLDNEVRLGAGFFISLLLVLIIILNSEKAKAYFNSKHFNIIYSLYFIGILLRYVFISSMLIGRLSQFFSGFGFIILGYFLWYSWERKRKVLSLSIIALIMLSFAAVIYRGADNCSLFVFNWQEQYYYVHASHKP